MADQAQGAGYSGTPLPRKLGLKPGRRVVAVAPPPQLAELLPGWPIDILDAPTGPDAVRLGERADVVLLFVVRRADLEAQLAAVGAAVFPDGMVWVSWPKKASKVPTDVTEDVVREVALPQGLVDTKVAAVDATWSGLRLVWRKERRSSPPPP